jgi:arylsulfatase
MPKNANGVLFALGGTGAGITCYMKDGYLNYEYNCFIVQRTKLKSTSIIPAGETKIEILMEPIEGTLVVPGNVSIKVNGKSMGKVKVPNLANLTLSTEGLEVGRDEHSPVSPDYADQGEFEFTGTIHNMNVKYLK